jgi:hypothetical protein
VPWKSARKESRWHRPESGLAQALDFLEPEIRPNVPRDVRGRGVTKRERERILG